MLGFWCSSDAKMTAGFGCFPISCPMPFPLFSSSVFLLFWVAGTFFFFIFFVVLPSPHCNHHGVAAGVGFFFLFFGCSGRHPPFFSFFPFLCCSLPLFIACLRIQTDKQTWQRGINLAFGVKCLIVNPRDATQSVGALRQEEGGGYGS